MKYYTDLHVHSHYSRATSKNLNLEHMHKWAQLKGIDVVGTGDFVHPGWLNEIKEKLEPAEDGLFRLKSSCASVLEDEIPAACKADVRFMLTVEISNIYKRLEKVRKVHNLVFAPHLEAAEKIQARLESIGNIRSDGRPILGLDSRDLLEIVLESDNQSYLIPAHIWTPWFSALGSKSGFDKMTDCFGDLSSHIFAAETGLSSDPPMNWRLSQLDPYILVSNSDAHSPQKIGREATIFDTEMSFSAIYNALKSPEDKGLVGTIEFFPEEGKYHYDGHRKCAVRLHPKESHKYDGRCPSCGKPVTIGVLARAEALADREDGARGARWRPYKNLIALPSIISEVVGVGPNSKRVQSQFQRMLARLGNEIYILNDAPVEDISRVAGAPMAEAIFRMREGKVHIKSGFDGEFGKIHIFSEEEKQDLTCQSSFLTQGSVGISGKGSADEGAFEQRFEESRLDAAGSDTLRRFPQSFLKDEEGDEAANPAEDDAERDGTLPNKRPEITDLYLGNSLPHDLNTAQWRAVTHSGKDLLIIAGPGTGKTHTLVQRIAHIAQCVARPEEILAITFTNKAAEELQQRLKQKVEHGVEQITVGTFHSFCLQFLRGHDSFTALNSDFKLAVESDREDIARKIWQHESPDVRIKNLSTVSKWKSGDRAAAMPDIVNAYNAGLLEENMLDFDDLILETTTLLQSDPKVQEIIRMRYSWFFIDEYQDVNPAQRALLKALAHAQSHITAIGDPDQAIYGFRGSDVNCFYQFKDDFPNAAVLSLQDNYRSGRNILSACGQVIGPIQNSELPALTAKIVMKGRLGIAETASDKAEAEYVVHNIEKLVGGTSMFSQDSDRVNPDRNADYSFKDITVLYRLNAQRKCLEEAFLRSGIPFQVSGDRPLIEHKAVAEIIGVLKLAQNDEITVSAAKDLLLLLSAGTGIKTASKIAEFWKRNNGAKIGWDAFCAPHAAGLMTGKARSGFKNLIDFCLEIRKRLEGKGFNQALRHFSTYGQWQNMLARNEIVAQIWQRLIRIAKITTSIDDFMDYLSLQREADALNHQVEQVTLQTMHAAKGLEYPVVFIIGCESGIAPLNMPLFQTDPDEERRLFYVAMSRAKDALYLSWARKRSLFGKKMANRPSTFIDDIEEKLKEYEAAPRVATRHGRKPDKNQMDLFG